MARSEGAQFDVRVFRVIEEHRRRLGIYGPITFDAYGFAPIGTFATPVDGLKADNDNRRG